MVFIIHNFGIDIRNLPNKLPQKFGQSFIWTKYFDGETGGKAGLMGYPSGPGEGVEADEGYGAPPTCNIKP